MKILFVATHPLLGTGYARVANKITNYLADLPGVEVVYYAVQAYFNQFVKDRVSDDRIKFYYAHELEKGTFLDMAFHKLQSVIEIEKPDALFIYNDIPVILNYLQSVSRHLLPPKIFLYVDIVYTWEKPMYFNLLNKFNITQIFTFLDFWKDHLINDMGFDKNKVTTLPHGVDFEKFKDIPTSEAKKELGLKPDDFLVVNMNRNSFRKGLNYTITGFLDFLNEQNMNPKLKLYLNGKIFTDGSTVSNDIREIIKMECFSKKLNYEKIIRNNIIFTDTSTLKSDEKINIIYNAADVGINTCVGEGFGLTCVEHAYLNKPQIVTELPVFKETLGVYGFWCDIEHTSIAPPEDCVHGYIHFPNTRVITKHLNNIFENKITNVNSKDFVKSKFSWENIYKVLDRFFKN